MTLKKSNGFTLIELMIALSISIIVFGTFFKIFNNTVKIESNNDQKNAVAQRGEYILNSLDSAMRLIGLSNTMTEFKAANVIITSFTGLSPANQNGGAVAGNLNFTFRSPYGGFVSKVDTVTGTSPACTFTLTNTAGVFAGATTFLITNKREIYTATGSVSGSGAITTSAITPAPINGTCASNFPIGTLITGVAIQYQLTYSNGVFEFKNLSTDTTIFSYNNTIVPFLDLEFLTEVTDASGVVTRSWKAVVPQTDPDGLGPLTSEVQAIKAVRFGFVMKTRENRDTATAGTVNHCIFEHCYTVTNSASRYLTFSRVVYLRNLDFLHRNSL